MSNNTSPWLIIEGNTDSIFFSTKNLPQNPIVITAKGWENVVSVIDTVITEAISPIVFGFIDRDYREELSIELNRSKIITTDHRDLEITMFESGALHRILVELGSLTKLPCTSIGHVDLAAVRARIYDVAGKLGRIRFFSLKHNLGISLKRIDLSKAIDNKILNLDEQNLLAQINSTNENKLKAELLSSFYTHELPTSLNDPRFLCSGHDVSSILGIALKKLWGTNSSKDVEQEKIESHLRIGFSDKDFSDTEMYKQLCRLLTSN
ncbi:DUF4435 domain-containing protein [Aeromonas sp. sia0103]|uniref:DUF4435 domain-containing protein n=1 Tax=Aeromonas sp. sia0103 TaxID=2854782 RepID=UPI001C47BC68|nr:DUF4435 domain-containing protein [Aeromonas sp. sia0103]MBV7599045.1 DUF4435 domain-containing protein [Aeromonas sp. sia0103]